MKALNLKYICMVDGCLGVRHNDSDGKHDRVSIFDNGFQLSLEHLDNISDVSEETFLSFPEEVKTAVLYRRNGLHGKFSLTIKSVGPDLLDAAITLMSNMDITVTAARKILKSCPITLDTDGWKHHKAKILADNLAGYGCSVDLVFISEP